jgi:hypothetical protein
MRTAQSGPAGALALSEKSSQISFNHSSPPLYEIGAGLSERLAMVDEHNRHAKERVA